MLTDYKSRPQLTRALDDFRGRFYDFIHNVDTFSFVSKASVKIESENGKFGFAYQRTPIRTIHTLFDKLVWREDAAFIDFGCGKGLALLAAANYSFNKIIGVEYSSDLMAIARRNIERYRGPLRSKNNIAMVHGDAAQFIFPSTSLVCYFYNPFGPVVMERVFDNLTASFQECPRDIQLVFHIRYSRDLVKSKFDILEFKSIPYFHIYRVTPAKEKREEMPEKVASWEIIDIELN